MKKIFYLFLLFIFSLCYTDASAQNAAVVSGNILNADNEPVSEVYVYTKEKQLITTTNDNGYFSINIPANKLTTLYFEHVEYGLQQKSFLLKEDETENISIQLIQNKGNLRDVYVSADTRNRDIGTIDITPDKAILSPSPIGGIEGLIKTYVGSNNELTSNYSVRGGNYDENLVYVNDYEIFRPFLVSSAQQEGLSFINPYLTDNVKFFTGGFQAKYGDKMSSVLDVTYKKPDKFGGSVYISPLEQGLHLEGASLNKKFTYLVGLRNRNNRNILQSQETTGNYIPSSSDIQAFLTWQINNKWSLELLGNYSQTKFSFFPKESQLTSSVLSPFFNANYSVDIQFEGGERDRYTTNFVGVTAVQQVNKNLQLKWMLSRFEDNETENTDIRASYLFGERKIGTDGSFGQIENPLGAGVNHQFARNKLSIQLWSAQHRGSWTLNNNFIQWGISAEQQHIDDVLNRWTYIDSAGYSLPYNYNGLNMFDVQKGDANLNVMRYSAFVQDNIKMNNNFLVNVGARINYNTLNNEFIFSPRAGISYKTLLWDNDLVFRASGGLYAQPPFYRELRRYDGSLNETVKAQKSWQGTIAMDYNFKMFDRPAKWTTEAYYKHLFDVNPYDIDNVRIRYYGNNNAKAFATGIETRLFGELVRDAESWISIGIMNTKEKIDGLSFTNYYNAAGELINSGTVDKTVADSALQEVGWVRRPTDRLLTFGMFFQDYLSSNKNFKVYLNSLYGSNMPYNLPNSNRFRNALTIPSYLRVDIGFSALLLDAEKIKRSYSPFKNFKNIWATLEVFNLINKSNTISYTTIRDFSNNTFVMPNRLTPRLLNFKIVAEW